MATERELNKRIKSIKNISQVTSALAAVSASKANKAQRQVEATRDYAGKAFEILNNLASQPGVGQTGHPLLTARAEIKKVALILVTGNRGLAGAYNSNMVGYAERFIKAINAEVEVIAVGRKGRDLLIRRGYNVVCIGDPDVVYWRGRRPAVKQRLPLARTYLRDMAVAEYVSNVDLSGVSDRVYTYEPGPADLLDIIVPRFTDLQVYQSVLEAQASEHSARYVAMNNATDNAAELIEILTLDRNKARQTAITSEILDIVGGAEALAQNS